MNPGLMVCAFLIVCSAPLALGQEHPEWQVSRQGVDGKVARAALAKSMADAAWLSKQSKDLLDIIEILYKGRDAEIKELEAAQAIMLFEDQIERRIALIKATLLEKGGKAEPAESPDIIAEREMFWAAREAWLSEQSKDLLDIIEILYKGREADLKELEATQAKMKSEDQIEHRIALIKATLSEKAAKSANSQQ
jgi:hypothetical protein